MKPMNPLDWLSIRLLQYYEENDPQKKKTPFHKEPGENDFVFLLRRTRRLLDEKYAVSDKKIGLFYRISLWGPIVITAIIALSLSPLNRAQSILGDDRIVNLAGPWLFFMILQLLFLALSLLALLFLAWKKIKKWGRRFYGKNEMDRKNTAKNPFLVSWFGTLLLTVMKGTALLCDFIGKRRTALKKNGVQDQNTEDSITPPKAEFGHFLNFLTQFSQSFLFFSAFLSHFFWTLLSLALLLILAARMQGNLYNYSWESSLGDVNQVHSLVHFLKQPLPKTLKSPEADEIDWLFINAEEGKTDHRTEETQRAKDLLNASSSQKTLDIEKESRIRKKWSVFLLATVFYWAFLPRFILALFYGILFRYSQRDWIPDLSLPYYAELLTESPAEPAPSSSEQRLDSFPGTEPVSPPRVPDMPSEITSKPLDSPEDLPPSEVHVLHSMTLALAYDAEINPEQWKNFLEDSPYLILFGNVVKTREKTREFIRFLDAHHAEIKRVILLINSAFPPARQIRLWIQNDLLGRLNDSQCFVILSCGERLRQKFGGDTIPISQRLQEWQDVFRQMEDALKRPIYPILGYDHEWETEEVRKRLKAYFCNPSPTQRGNLAQMEGLDHLPKNSFSNRFDQGTAIIIRAAASYLQETAHLENIQEIRDTELSEFLQHYLSEGYGELLTLYQSDEKTKELEGEDKNPLTRSLYYIADQGNRLGEKFRQYLAPDWENLIPRDWQEAVRKGEGTADDLLQRLSNVSRTIEKVQKLCRHLSPKGALIFGAAGLSLPVAAATAPILGSGLAVSSVLASVASLGTCLPAALTGGTLGAAFGAALPLSLSALGKRLRHLTDSSASSPLNQSGSREIAGDLSDKLNESNQSLRGEGTETLTFSLAIWRLLFELQGRSEEEIADRIPKFLAPLENVHFFEQDENVLHQIQDAFTEMGKNLDD